MAGRRYLSRATRVRVRGRAVSIERERRIAAGSGATHADAPAPAPGRAHGERAAAPPEVVERNVVELARVSVSRLQREAPARGLSAAGTREIPATEDHVGSAVVMLGA